jgi:hypothetical protein
MTVRSLLDAAEDQMGIRGQFKKRPREVAGFINEPFAAGVIYPAVLAAWTFLALQGQPSQRPGDQKTDFTWEIDPTDVGIPIGVFFVGLVCSFAYNRWLRKERPFLAELFDSKGDELDKRLLVSHFRLSRSLSRFFSASSLAFTASFSTNARNTTAAGRTTMSSQVRSVSL